MKFENFLSDLLQNNHSWKFSFLSFHDDPFNEYLIDNRDA